MRTLPSTPLLASVPSPAAFKVARKQGGRAVLPSCKALCSEGTSARSPPNVGLSLLAGIAGLSVSLTATPAAVANNVRLQDVENPLMKAGVTAATERHWPEAERFFQALLSQDSGMASAWSNLGNVHLSEGRPAEAMNDFSKAVALAPDAAVPYLNRALAEEQLGVEAMAVGNKTEAEEHYHQALQDCRSAQLRDPKEFAAYFNAGNVQVRLGNFGGALESYTHAADLAPGISGYRLREAELLFQNDRVSDASQMMRGVVRKNPRYAEAHAALAAVNWAAGLPSIAEDHFHTATQLDQRWARLSFVRSETRWPPLLYQAMEKFLAIEAPAS